MDYILKRSKRKTLSLEITLDSQLIVKAPNKISQKKIDEFINNNIAWINEKVKLQEKRKHKSEIISLNEELLRYTAERTIPKLVYKYSNEMNIFPTSVKITSAQKRFGSCSSNNSICFSWRLLAYDKSAVDYVVVHELAHIKHHNHSKDFYKLIEKYLPDYKNREKLLKENNLDFNSSYCEEYIKNKAIY